MKRSVPVFLLVLLLLGCASEEAPDTGVQTTTAPTQAAVVDTYVADSTVEQSTNGAVRQYVTDQPLDWITPISGGVLTATVGEQTELTLLSGTTGTVTASATVPLQLSRDAVWQVTAGGYIYYDAAAKQVVFLDLQLHETKRLQLPADMPGDPAISQNGSEVFYCVGQTVYAMDTMQKTVRPVRTNTCKEQTLLGCYLDGAVVACRVLDIAEQWNTLYISGEDGKLLHMDNGIQKIYSGGDTYFALRQDGIVDQFIYGKTGEAPVQMNIGTEAAYGALELGGIIGQTETAEGIQLSYYNMKKTAVVTLPLDIKPVMVAADSTVGGAWLLTESGTLLHWTLQASAVTEDVDYSGNIYTAQAPDAEGLKACADRGDAIGNKHGVVIRVWERALVSNDAYDIEVEYQTEAINKTLDALETELQKFPDKFLYKSVSGQIRICIVRSIGGEMTSAYHWYDGDPFIIISAGMDVEQAFMEAFSHVLDIHVLGNSSLADDWESLNPGGFIYGTDTTAVAYLEGETRAFTDGHAMESVTDDRASVFYYAMQADNAEMFQSETMQAKLLMLCKAIRDAWRLEKKTETYLWEQYLNQSLAYQG